jgi:hypothetical protein
MQTRPDPVFPVGFDEDALVEDLERLSEGAVEAFEAFRKELRREGGIPHSRLKSCHDEGQDGTCSAAVSRHTCPGRTAASVRSSLP